MKLTKFKFFIKFHKCSDRFGKIKELGQTWSNSRDGQFFSNVWIFLVKIDWIWKKKNNFDQNNPKIDCIW